MPGASYELLFALHLLADRVETRKSFVILSGVKGALQPTIDEHWFKAVMEDDEAAGFYAGLHADRVRFQMEKGRHGAALKEFMGEG